MRESSITASVNDTLPVIAKAGSAAVFQNAEVGASCKAWSDGKPKGYAAERFPNVKALGRPGRCGLLRERSRPARLRPVDAIRRGALSGAHALWSSGSESNSPPSCGVLDEAGSGTRTRQPFAVSKGKREIHAAIMRFGWLARTALFFCSDFSAAQENQPQRAQSSTE